jgi:hypothetical protein
VPRAFVEVVESVASFSCCQEVLSYNCRHFEQEIELFLVLMFPTDLIVTSKRPRLKHYGMIT